MRTLIIILGGFVVWGICLGAFRLFGGSTKSATVTFVTVWFVVAASNMWMGISQAGYSFGDELPIFLVIFLLPAAVAVFVNWKFL